MLMLLLAFAPFMLALVMIGMIRLFMSPRASRAAHALDADLAAQQLVQALGRLGLETEACTTRTAPFELICRDARPVVGGRWVVHALPSAEPRAASSADVLMLAESVYRARGVKGVFVANGFTAQARSAARTALQVVELVAWGDLAHAPAEVGSGEMRLMPGLRAP